MTATLLTPLFETMLDNNGIPLAGGLIYTYSAGTTTPQATYTDATGTTPASNPIVLDSAGRPPNGGVWGSGVYKFILKTSAGVQVGDAVDNVTAIYGAGDMTKAVYDAANVAQQLVGTTAVQTLTNKTLTTPTISAPIITGFETVSTQNRGVGAATTFTANTTYGDISAMTWDLGVGSYDLKFSTRVDQLAAGGNKLQIVFSGTQTAFQATYFLWNLGTTTPLAVNTIASPGALTSSTTGATNFWQVDVKITVSVAGTLKFQGAQQASNASGTSFTFPTATCKLMS